MWRKRNRLARLERRRRKQAGKNRHHLLNKVRGGDCSPENLLVLKKTKHEAWHTLFKNSDPEYIIAVLERMMKMKGYRRNERRVAA